MFLDIRISDNVLEPRLWTRARLHLRHLRVASVEVLHQGAYSVGIEPGDTIHRVANVLSYDPSGEHPEVVTEANVYGEWTFLPFRQAVRALMVRDEV